jgi:hypothetical protein
MLEEALAIVKSFAAAELSEPAGAERLQRMQIKLRVQREEVVEEGAQG